MEGVLDRIVDNKTGVIIVEEEGKEYYVSVDKLPKNISEGDILNFDVVEEEIVNIVINREKTKQRKERIKEKLDRLSKPLFEE